MLGSLINTTTTPCYIPLPSLIYYPFKTCILLTVKLLLLFINSQARNLYQHITMSLVVPLSPRNGLPVLKVIPSSNKPNVVFAVFLLDSHLNKMVIYYPPHSHTIAVSGDVSFDETFCSAIAMTWHHFNDSLLLQPSHSFLPDPDTVLEETGTIEHFSSDCTFEEGFSALSSSQDTATTLPSESSSLAPSLDDTISSLVIDDSASSSHPRRAHCPPHRLSIDIHHADQDWIDHSNFCSDMELVQAYTTDATNTPCNAPGSDASIFVPLLPVSIKFWKSPTLLFVQPGSMPMVNNSLL